jgi:hypothetical protein
MEILIREEEITDLISMKQSTLNKIGALFIVFLMLAVCVVVAVNTLVS